MKLNISIRESPTGKVLLDVSRLVSGLSFSTNKHGYSDCSFFIRRSLYDSFYLYDRPGLPHLAITWQGLTVWEGRLEDVAIVDSGIRMGAFGYWRALGDAPYTALWSTTRTDDWLIADERNVSNRAPKKYQFDTNNRLSIEPTKNTVYTNASDFGSIFWLAPSQTHKRVVALSFDYSITLPNNWITRIQSITVAGTVTDGAFTGTSLEDITATGSNQTGSKTYSFSADDGVLISILNNTGAGYTMTAENGAWFARITNVRIKGGSSTDSDDIAAGLVAYINTINANHLNSGTGLIESPGLDLTDEIYYDQLPTDILDRLAILGDGTNTWEAGVWENRLLHFRQRGSQGRAWYVDVSSVEIERTLEILRNSAYAAYQDINGRAQRSAVSSDSFSVARYGLTRRAAVPVSTTNSSQATDARDAFLNDHKDPIPRAALVFRKLFDASGGLWPNFAARSGDTITIRNLPPTLATDIDRIRTFVVAETEYYADTNAIVVVPESPLPTLDVLIARQAS